MVPERTFSILLFLLDAINIKFECAGDILE